VGSFIDPKRLEKQKPEKKPGIEQYLPVLQAGLRLMAKEKNRDYGEFLNEEGKIILAGKSAESDRVLVAEQEMILAHGLDREEYRRQRENKQAEIAEMALALLFNKMLGNRFLVARASAYDDYNNGVDLVIIDKTTGAVVCGVDDVVSHFVDVSAPKKEDKIAKKMKTGGATIKYGATFNEGQMTRCAQRNIPAFFVAISPAELEKIVMALEENKARNTMTELDVFDRMIASLEAQYKNLDDKNLDPNLRANLHKFAASLERMKQAR